MSIEYGSTEYFEMLTLRDRLDDRCFNKLDLINLDALRIEVEIKIKALQDDFKRTQEEQK